MTPPPPGRISRKAYFLDNGESANAERYVFGKRSARSRLFRCVCPAVLEKTGAEIDPEIFDENFSMGGRRSRF